jgi:hypothetical protein
MSNNDKVGTTISGGGGVNLISADAFVEIRWKIELSRVVLLRTITHFSNYYQRSFQDTEISANSADKSTNSDFYFMIIPLNYYST